MDNNKPEFTSTDEYIATFSPDVQHILQRVREAIKEAAPDATEKISYQMPAFALHGNLVYFAAYKNHIGFYPASTGLNAFQEEIAPYRSGKGTLQFPIAQPIPFDLIKKIVSYRVAQNIEKAAAKAKTKKKK
ncbi:iron chaperone [Cohnella yongneupensis]|uniref:Iron chaperone n=1 Tax=Cohnella yongneupensis TaxID=425006 RepID=A0ABW0R172_9BACL